MELRIFIELGEKKAGKQIELARYLEIRDTTLRLAKSGKKGLPDDICIKLADYINADRLEVIAASNLVTEKDDAKRKIFESCFKKVSGGVNVLSGLFISLSVLLHEQINAVQCILC